MIINELTTALNAERDEETLAFTDAFKRLSGLALPMAASYTFSLEMWLLGFFLSRLNADKTHSAAITPITDMINALVIIGISPLFAMSMIAGKKYGELRTAQREDETPAEQQELEEDIARVNHHGLLIATTMVPFISLPLIFSEPILAGLFKQNPEVAKISQSFLRPYAIAVPALVLRICSEQMMFSFGRTKPAMIIGLINASIGMGLATVLAYGKLDAPELREKGLLIGYIIEAYLTSFAFALYIAHHPEFKNYGFFQPKNIVANFHKIKEVTTIGGPILLGNAVEMGCILATGAISGLCGVSAQASFSTTMQFTLLTFLLQSAFGQSCCQEMSRFIGEKSYHQASKMGLSAIPTTLAFVAPLPILFAIRPQLLMQVLGQEDNEKYSIIRILVPMMALAVLIDAVRYNILQQLRNNLGDGKPATIISSASLLSGVFLSWLLGSQTNLGIFGVALGYIIGVTAATAGLSYRWKSRITADAIQTQYEGIASHREGFFTPSASDSLNSQIVTQPLFTSSRVAIDVYTP